MVLCTSTNEAYALGATIALTSALRRVPAQQAPTRVYVLDGGMRSRTWKRLSQSLVLTGRPHELVRLLPSMEQFADFPKDWGASVMTYARLALPALIGERHVLYVDADMIVQADPTTAWETDLQGHIIGAVRDPIIQRMGNEGLPIEQLRLPPDAPYFQAGFLKIDLLRWRAENISDQVSSYLRDWSGHARHWDQSALNVVLLGKWQEIATEWNTPAWLAEHEQGGRMLHNAALHFVGPNKPWIHGCHTGAAAERFFAEVDRTAWRGWRPTRWRYALKWAKYQTGRMFRH